MRTTNERGIAMITTLLVLMLMSALLVGFATVVMSDQRYRFIDRDRGQAFYAASAGVEKLTADIGNLFLEYVAPTATQVQNLTTTPPSISGITFVAPQGATGLPASQLTTYHCNGRDPVTNAFLSPATKAPVTVGGNGYTVTFCKSVATGNPTVSDDNLVISGTGAYSGMTALQSPYQLDVTAKTASGGEVHLVRTMQSVAIPVFQFGIFSESDLSFFAEKNFGFGGRIHTNGNLWLGQFAGTTLTTTGKITAVGDVVRQYMSNGASSTAMGLTGTVSLATSLLSPTGNRSMALTEGSVTGLPGSAPTTSPVNWQSLSNGTAYYNGFIKTTATGAKRLTLPLTATGVGGTNIDLIRRPCITGAPAPCTGVQDDVTSILYNERLFTKASLRILLSDTAADITNIPGVTATPPVLLDGNWNTTAPSNGGAVVWGGVSAASGRPPIATSIGSAAMTTNAAVAVANPQTIGLTAAVPANFAIATLTVGTVPQQTNVICTGRTLTTFTGCTAATNATILLGAPVTAVVNGQTVSTTLAANWLLGATTITVPAGGTAPFANGVLWLKPTAVAQAGSTPAVGSPLLVTCSGLQTANPYFQNCVGVTSAAPNAAAVTTSALSTAGTGTIGGYLKIEKSNNAVPPVWTDVTMEILNYGFGANNLSGTFCGGAANWDPTPNAIIRLQRLRDNPGGTPTTAGGGCFYSSDTAGWRNPANWWPNVLFDSREATLRDADPNNSQNGYPLGGIMYYVTLDAKNLAKWFNAAAPYAAGTGGGSRTDNGGYTVYFSDRRNNRNALSQETGEFGWEDFVNPGVANGVPNNTCNLPAEDVNGNGTCETYGQTPNYNGAYNANVPGAAAPLTNAATPTTLVFRGQAQVNRPIIFRRALKLVNGATLGSDATVANRISGLTVVSENPVYLQGDWNASAADFPPGTVTLHAATAIIADSVTLLSNSWNDNFSFVGPYTYATGGRLRTAQSYYRVAILAGKGINFPSPSDIAAGTVFGTDGGPHNFLRMLEQDGGGATNTVNYRGSMASLYYNRQAVGTFKCCSGTASDGIVYSVPVRNFFFDTDFLQPALLPPNTPMFRDLNVIGFSQELRPGK